jgi:ParB/RepB/Spo0J family partition protein
MELPTTMNIGLKLLVEGPNIRKHFNAQKHDELTANVRLHGVLQALLVRPRWCVGISARAEIERLQGRGDLQSTPFEIVAGARRFRAGAAAELAAVPCTVRYFTDAEAFDIQLIENLQRDDLTPIEEAQGYHDALALRIDGQPVHTIASLAAHCSKGTDHIQDRLKLLTLPADGMRAVEEGILPPTIAVLVSRVPDVARRAECLDQVLKGHRKDQPLTKEETLELIKREYQRELKAAPFDQEDPALCALTVAGRPDFERWSGRCSDCPYRTGNIQEYTGQGRRTDICTNPECYTLKATAAFDRLADAAEAEGKTILRTGDAARHFDPLGELVFTTTLVRLAAKPREDQLKAEVRRAPTWAALRETAIEAGLDVPIYVTRNPRTSVVEELIDSAPLIAAAKKIGEPIFRGTKDDEPMFTPKKAGEDEDDAFRRGQREAQERDEATARKDAAAAKGHREQAKLAYAVVLDRLAEHIPGTAPFCDALVPSFVAAAGRPGLRFVIEAFGLKPGGGEFEEPDCVEKWLRGLKPAARFAGSLMLLIADMVAVGHIHALEFRALAQSVDVDLDSLGGKKPKKTKRGPVKAAKRAKVRPAKPVFSFAVAPTSRGKSLLAKSRIKKPAAKRGKKRGAK